MPSFNDWSEYKTSFVCPTSVALTCVPVGVSCKTTYTHWPLTYLINRQQHYHWISLNSHAHAAVSTQSTRCLLYIVQIPDDSKTTFILLTRKGTNNHCYNFLNTSIHIFLDLKGTVYSFVNKVTNLPEQFVLGTGVVATMSMCHVFRKIPLTKYLFLQGYKLSQCANAVLNKY